MAEILLPSEFAGRSLVSAIDEYSNPESLAVGSLVYFEGANVVRRADNASAAELSARGIIIAKTAAAVATVMYAGPADVLAGLTPGEEYFLGPAGDVVDSSGLPTAPGSVIQRVGRALNETTLLFSPGQPITL